MTDLIERIRDAAGGKLPARYRDFLEEEEYARLPFLHLAEGYVTGTFEATFDDADYLCSLEAIGEDFGIDDIADIDWAEDYEDYAPFAVLAAVDADGERDDEASAELGAFLVIKLDQPQCPIYLFEAKGWMLYPLAMSLDDFLAGDAWSGKDPEPHDNLGAPFEAFDWVDEVPDADD